MIVNKSKSPVCTISTCADQRLYLHYWLQCPSASQQTWWEELQTPAYPWLFLIELHQKLRSNHIYPYVCLMVLSFTKHWSAAGWCWLKASDKLKVLSLGVKDLDRQDSPEMLFNLTLKGRRSELTHAVNPIIHLLFISFPIVAVSPFDFYWHRGRRLVWFYSAIILSGMQWSINEDCFSFLDCGEY